MLTISKGGFLNPWKPSSAPPVVLTSIQLVYFQCVRCSWEVCECVMLLFFFCIFLCKAMWCTAHGYYSTGAGHSVALKQFRPSSRTYEERDLFINKSICYTKHIYATLMLHTGIWTVNFSMICLSTGCMVVLEHYSSCDGLLQRNQSCIERPPWNSLNKQFIPKKCIHVF